MTIPSRLTLIRKTARSGYSLYHCVCGKEKEILRTNVTSAKVKSCGCYNSEVSSARRITHGILVGGQNRPAYTTWNNMNTRCGDPQYKWYHNYGGRGITVCQRWRESFPAFYADMGRRPANRTIDRIDNDKGYWCGKAECPECGPLNREPNCRWATRKEQDCNRGNNRMVTYNDRTLHLSEWSRVLGLGANTLRYRLDRGWPVERAFNTPGRKKRIRR